MYENQERITIQALDRETTTILQERANVDIMKSKAGETALVRY